MLNSISYTYTPGGKMLLLNGDGVEVKGSVYDVLGVVAQPEPGVFEVKWKGAKVEIGHMLLLPVKGAKNTSLKMLVEKVDPLITPVGSWSAVCQGPVEREFNLKNIEANCDTCGKDYKLEFVAYSNDDQKDALAALNMQGWRADAAAQICPNCHI